MIKAMFRELLIKIQIGGKICNNNGTIRSINVTTCAKNICTKQGNSHGKTNDTAYNKQKVKIKKLVFVKNFDPVRTIFMTNDEKYW